MIQVNIAQNLQRLLAAEDTDGDLKITINDQGQKRFLLQGLDGQSYEVNGTYYLSNLLQELALVRDSGLETAEIHPEHIFESPVERLNRLIRDYFWDGLTRCLDADGLQALHRDDKFDQTDIARLYVPAADAVALDYFQQAVKDHRAAGWEIIRLPEAITPAYVRSINMQPGLLCLGLVEGGDGNLHGRPFVVPGGRFNEMYGWDSYFESLGLLADGRVDLARNMVDNFCYQIIHYGQILNANRTYYLTRSQPPFLTSMALAVYHHSPKNEQNRRWLQEVLIIAMWEYHRVWMNAERLTPTGLSRYYGYGIGIPPETEAGHYDAVLTPYASAAGKPLAEFIADLQTGEITDESLREYFLHDRAVRESGHDTSYRLEGCCAHLNPVDLNALLYKYECDIADAIEQIFEDHLKLPDGSAERSAAWRKRAASRRATVDQLLWNEQDQRYYDYHFVHGKARKFDSATAFYPLWAGMASARQAEALLIQLLPKLEAPGGLLACTAESRGPLSAERPARQWDYPNGWAPHQMLLWEGLSNYGYDEDARRLAYRWLDMITRNAADHNGTIPEKYDVMRRSHQVLMEYGNVGTEFDYITREGFGWMNASYQVGLNLLSESQRRQLERLVPSEWLFGAAPAD